MSANYDPNAATAAATALILEVIKALHRKGALNNQEVTDIFNGAIKQFDGNTAQAEVSRIIKDMIPPP